MKPAQYWRANKIWHAWLGKQGTVVASTIIHVAGTKQSYLTPYSYVIVDFGEEKKEFMSVSRETLEIGDTVICVLRKTAQTEAHELIEYGIKVTKVLI